METNKQNAKTTKTQQNKNKRKQQTERVPARPDVGTVITGALAKAGVKVTAAVEGAGPVAVHTNDARETSIKPVEAVASNTICVCVGAHVDAAVGPLIIAIGGLAMSAGCTCCVAADTPLRSVFEVRKESETEGGEGRETEGEPTMTSVEGSAKLHTGAF